MKASPRRNLHSGKGLTACSRGKTSVVTSLAWLMCQILHGALTQMKAACGGLHFVPSTSYRSSARAGQEGAELATEITHIGSSCAHPKFHPTKHLHVTHGPAVSGTHRQGETWSKSVPIFLRPRSLHYLLASSSEHEAEKYHEESHCPGYSTGVTTPGVVQHTDAAVDSPQCSCTSHPSTRHCTQSMWCRRQRDGAAQRTSINSPLWCRCNTCTDWTLARESPLLA